MAIIHQAGHSAFLVAETVFNRIFGNKNNPLYHLGPLIFYFFWIVLFSGLYIFVFFETSVDHAYDSVEYMTHEQWWLAGIMRSLHRYASDAAVVGIFLHLFREFSRDRYRSVRWFSWFLGVPTLWLVILLGISGYWLVWDQMAQYLAIATSEMVDWLPIAPGAMASNFLVGQVSDRFFTLMAFLHLAGFPVGMVFLLWTHVSRISQVAFMPPKELAIGTLAALVVLSLIHPAVSHPPANLTIAPTILHLDWFYLNIYPVFDHFGPMWAWGSVVVISALLLAMPWLPPKRGEPIPEIRLDLCDGCQQCARDCPFGAISMQPRKDGRHYTFEPTLDPSICTSCGICVGACHTANPYRQPKGELKAAIDMPFLSMEALRQEVREKIASLSGDQRILLIGCRFGASLETFQSDHVATLMFPCTGMLPPSLLDFALKKGADGVFLTGCRDGDCFYRLGNRLIQERIDHQREPHLFTRTDRQRIGIYRASLQDIGQLTDEVAAFRQQLSAHSGHGAGQ